MNDYESYDGLGLAALVKKRAVSASELLEVAIARCERRNPALNAVVIPMFERGARGGAEAPPRRGRSRACRSC